MKKILSIIFLLASFASYAQTSTFGGIGLRVNDTTTYQTNAAALHTAGYYDIYFNNQATNDHWDVWNGSSYDHIFSFNSGSGGGTWGSITGTLSSQTDLQSALDLKSPLASPAFTGTPTTPTAAINDSTTTIANTAWVQRNAISLNPSFIYPGQNSYQMFGIETEDVGTYPFELLNIGNPGFVPQGTETRNIVPAGIVRIGGNIHFLRNITWDQANLEWDTYSQVTDAYGSGLLEMGGEGINFHVSPSGATFGTTLRMAMSVRAEGARQLTGYTTGPVNQILAPLFAQYRSAGGNASWLPTTAATPMVHLLSQELKGTAGTFDQNEYLRLETNSSTSTVYPALNFKNSGGTYGSRTAILTNKSVGQVGSVVYDGTTDQKTAEILFTTRGTIASGNAGQSIKFVTSPDNTAGLLSRMEIMDDGVIKHHVPWRYDLTSITTVPDYSTFLTTPVMTTSTLGQIQQASASTGGLRFFGFGTTSTAATAVPLIFSGVLGATAPTAPAMVFNALKHNGSTSATDIAATEILAHFRNNATTHIEILGSGRAGFGVTTPTANIHIKASTTAASTGQIKLAEGSNLTTPEDGNINYVSNNLNFTESSTVYTLAKTLTNTGTLNFDLTSVNTEDLTITVTGAADGDPVSIAVPNASATANVIFTAWVSAANTVTVRASRVDVASGANPASGTFRASVIHY